MCRIYDDSPDPLHQIFLCNYDNTPEEKAIADTCSYFQQLCLRFGDFMLTDPLLKALVQRKSV